MTDSRPRQDIEATLAQHENAARITASRIGRIAAQVVAGDFSVARVQEIALALVPLTVDLVAIGKSEECAARHEACGETAARNAQEAAA